MLSLPLLVTTLALAPTGGSSRLELEAGASFQAGTVRLAPSSAVDDGSAVGGQGGVGLTLFGHRISDDDAPPSLQPYLQYAFLLHVDGGAGGFHFTRNAGSTLPGNDSTSGYADASVSGYFDRAVYGALVAGMRYRSDSAGNSTSLTLPLSVAAGFRLGDVRLSGGWSVTPTRIDDGSFEVPFWGGAFGQVYAVVQRRLSLVAEVDVVEGGASARGGATLYFLRRFAAGASVNGGHGSESVYGFGYDAAGADVTFETWVAPRFAIRADYSFQWTRYAYANGLSEDDYSSTLGLSFAVRPR